MTPETFHESRAHRIGGRDAAAICGEDGYQTIHDVFLRLTGATESRDEMTAEERDGPIELGTYLEPFIRMLYTRDTGLEVRPPGDGRGPVADPEKPWLGGHEDGTILCPSRGEGVLEIKSVDLPKLTAVKRNGIARDAMIQNIHYQNVKRIPWGAVIFHERRYSGRAIFTLDARESEAVADLRGEVSNEVDNFWHSHVVPRVMPDLPPASSGYVDSIKADEAVEVIDDPVYTALLRQLAQADELVAESCEFKAGVKADLDTFMQQAGHSLCESSAIIDGASRCLRYRWREVKGRRTLQGPVLVKFVQHIVNLVGKGDFKTVEAALSGFDVERFFKTSEPKMAGRHDWITNREG